MQEFWDLPFGQIEAYPFLVGLGSILGSLFVIYMYYRISRDLKQSLLVYGFGLILVLAANAGGVFLRWLSYGRKLNVQSVQQLFTEHQGSHFIGRVLLLVVVYPFLFSVLFRKEREKQQDYMNCFVLFLTFQHIFNRLACFFRGCCYGKFYEGPGRIWYQDRTGSGPAIDYPVYASQLIEVLGMVLLLILLLILFLKGKQLTVWFEAGFGLAIFISEFFMDAQGTILVLGLSVIQWAAVILMMKSAADAILYHRQKEKG